MWHTGGDEYWLEISGPYLLWFGCEDGLKILNKRMTHELIIYKGVCKTALATPSLLKIYFAIPMLSNLSEWCASLTNDIKLRSRL